ncbi:MAG TPA: STAS domain-containing protein [Usitatibacter sp.]|jgi:rsbT co-antagonist protein RsbR|nr:STAS domain-containing protein [Usitatibacter sp.]
MNDTDKNKLAAIIRAHEAEILADWLKVQASVQTRHDQVHEAEVRTLSRDFLAALVEALRAGAAVDLRSETWSKVRDMLTEVSASRARLGFSPSETATFVFSLKQPVFSRLRKELGNDAQKLADETWAATAVIDKLGLYTTEAYQKTREEVIARQQRELLELSTPVVALWDDILALPLIGTLDSNRTQVVMESLLERIVETGASLAIIDITGVPTVDTLVAQHLMKTVQAARLMGADCIISGIRPQIAQTIVHLGVDLSAVTTKASLADAFALALDRMGARLEKKSAPAAVR